MVHWNLLKRRQVLAAQIVSLLIIVIVAISYMDEQINASQGRDKLTIVDSFKLPMLEISGIDWRKNGDAIEIVSVGDHDAKISTFNLESRETQTFDFSKPLVKDFTLCRNTHNPVCAKILKHLKGDWEALRIDRKTGDLMLLQEHSETIIRLSPDYKEIKEILSFDLMGALPENLRASSQKFRANSLGEGMVFEKDRILVVKEMFPISIVQLGASHLSPSKNSRIELPAQKSWEMAGHSKCDFSDLAYHKGHYLVVSQKCRQLYFFQDIDGENGRLTPHTVIDLPKKIRKPEALTVLEDGRIVVASDLKKIKKNLFVLRFSDWNVK